MRMLNEKLNQLCLKIIDQVFSPMTKGTLVITAPGTKPLIYGGDSQGICAYIHVKNMDFFRKCVFYGAVGFGESFVDGDWETKNVTDVISWMIDNHENHPTMGTGPSKKRRVNYFNWFNIIAAKMRKNNLKGSQRNIMDHYDLGNDFFEAFLDSTMAYSSAYFTDDTNSLEEAQMNKYDQLCKKLRLSPSDHLLEIGTGWGGFAIYAAEHYKCKITTTTISKEQYQYAKKQIQERGLAAQIDVQLRDYRHLIGQYDKIVSIEMIEAVGHEFLEIYIKKCTDLLKPKGLFALQMILFPDHRYDKACKNIDWIQKHIFPGSLLPSMEAIQKAMKKCGNMSVYHYEDITSHYAKTLKIWRERFLQNINRLASLGKDGIFRRKWIYYLSYCEAAFQMRHIHVAQVVYTNANNDSLHDPLEVELSVSDQKMLSELNNNVESKVRS